MEIGIGKALEYSGLGIAIVFVLIIVLMIVVKIMSAIIRGATAARDQAAASRAAANASASGGAGVSPAASGGAGAGSAAGAAADQRILAPGSAGDVKLYDVPDRDAAMIMAIVAHQLKVPLNELRFLSIREVKEDEV